MFILKPGNDDYTKERSFCPITLTSHVFKTMEKVILNHLQNVYDIHRKLMSINKLSAKDQVATQLRQTWSMR